MRVRFQVEIHRALVRAGLAVTITVWKPLLTLQHDHRCTSRVECCYLHRNKPLYWSGGSASEKGTQCEKWVQLLLQGATAGGRGGDKHRSTETHRLLNILARLQHTLNSPPHTAIPVHNQPWPRATVTTHFLHKMPFSLALPPDQYSGLLRCK